MSSPTSEDLFKMQVYSARRVVELSKYLQVSLRLQLSMGKALAKKIPGLTDVERQATLDGYAAVETDLEFMEADDLSFANLVDSFEKLRQKTPPDQGGGA